MEAEIAKRLQSCVIDGREGAFPVRVSTKHDGKALAFSLLLCLPCVEKYRLPETRAE